MSLVKKTMIVFLLVVLHISQVSALSANRISMIYQILADLLQNIRMPQFIQINVIIADSRHVSAIS